MSETDPTLSDDQRSPDPAAQGMARPFVADLAIGAGPQDSKPLAPSRASEVPRALLERWRLTPAGRVRDSGSTEIDRVVAACMHLWPITTALLGPFSPLVPLVLWGAFRRRSPLIDDHGREVINLILTLLLLLAVPCLGWILLIVWLPIQLVSLVRGAVSAGSGELFRYPMTLRPIA